MFSLVSQTWSISNFTTYPMKSFCIGGILLLTNQPEDTTLLGIWSPHLKIYRSFRDKPRPERHDLSLGGNSKVGIKPRSRSSLWKKVRCCGKVRGQNHLARWKVQLQLKWWDDHSLTVRNRMFHFWKHICHSVLVFFVWRNFHLLVIFVTEKIAYKMTEKYTVSYPDKSCLFINFRRCSRCDDWKCSWYTILCYIHYWENN